MKYIASASANRLRILSLAMLVAALCLVSGCSGKSSATPMADVGTPAPPPATSTHEATQVVEDQTPVQASGGVFSGDTIKIGVDLPTSSGGTPDEDIIGVRDAVQLAIEQANNSGGVVVGGRAYKLDMYALDDQGDPDTGVKNAQTFVTDPAVLAMVGPYNSSVAMAQMSIFNRADLSNISPSNTVSELTKPEYGKTQDLRPTGKLTYFRVVAPDDLQPPASADYMYDKLHARRIYVLEDADDYGKAWADSAIRRFREDGGTVLGHENLTPDAQNYQTILKRIVDTKPDVLYYGGGDMVGIRPGLIRKQMAEIGFNVPFVGGDAIVTPSFLEDAGATAQGSYATITGAQALVLPTAQQFVTDFKTRFGRQLTAKGGYFYAALAYDATNIIIAAMKRAQTPDRESVRQQIASTKDFKGTVGSMSFDQNGDTTLRWISIFTVQDGDWAWFDQLNYQGTLP